MEQAADVTGLSGDYLRNIMYVERSVPPSRRREQLSFSTHAEVAPLTPMSSAQGPGWSAGKELSPSLPSRKVHNGFSGNGW